MSSTASFFLYCKDDANYVLRTDKKQTAEDKVKRVENILAGESK